jgi:hypothetical protein
MKKLCLLLLLGLAASARAEDPPSPDHSQTNAPATAEQTTQAHTAPQPDQKLPAQTQSPAWQTPLHVEQLALGEPAHDHFKMDGILVELVKTDNPWQLINPAAPERYGSAEDNVARDITSGKVSGLKFFGFRF